MSRVMKKSTSTKRTRSRKVNMPDRAKSKSELILTLLHKKDGATIAELMTATGWQAHSVRGFLSGTVKKKFGLALVSQKEAGSDRTYRIDGSERA